MVSLLLAMVLAGCAEPACTDMLDGPGGLVVTQAEHPTGWGQEACEGCHVTEALHRRGCTAGVDLAQVRDVVETNGYASCTSCHGDNGVSP